jgi:pyruvate/2-oxoglutarate dehydrogenase complex dihydrolipoamide dehydrogenase (E3) component
VFDVHDIEDSLLTLSFLERRNPQKIAIIGAGNIGLELAEAMHRKGKEVFLIEILETPVPTFPTFIQRAVLKKMKEKGVS